MVSFPYPPSWIVSNTKSLLRTVLCLCYAMLQPAVECAVLCCAVLVVLCSSGTVLCLQDVLLSVMSMTGLHLMCWIAACASALAMHRTQ